MIILKFEDQQFLKCLLIKFNANYNFKICHISKLLLGWIN